MAWGVGGGESKWKMFGFAGIREYPESLYLGNKLGLSKHLRFHTQFAQ